MVNFKENLLLNRIIALLVGGLLVFAIMSLTVVQTEKKETARLTVALDDSRYEAGRLLADAKAQLESKDYPAAKASIENLLANQPGSDEAVEGKALLSSIETAESATATRWEAALPQLKEDWSKAMAADLRAKSDKERADLEASLEKTINQAWDKAESKIQTTWEKEDMEIPAIS